MEKGKPRIKRKSIDESEKEEPEKVKQKLQKEPLKNSKRKLDTDSRDEHLRSLTLEGRRRSGSLDLSEVSKSSRNPSEERELEGSSTYPEQKRVNHGYTHTSGSYEHKNTRLVESKTNSNESRASRTLSSESKRGEFYRNVQSPRADQKVLEMLENFEDETDLTLFKFVSSVANGTINPVTSVDALRTKFHGVCKNSTLVFKVLDVVSFFLDDPKKKQNLLPFLESLESFGLVSSMEIISVIDPAKLDSCNYSEGLVKISIRERTKNNYVLKIYNLFRENYHGYTALSNYLSSLVDKHGRNGFRFDVVQKSNKKQSTQNRVKELEPDTVVTMVNKISGMHKLCPVRTLYELLKWLVLNNHSDEFVMKVLKSYPSKKVSYVVLLYLRNNYQNKDSLISRLGKEGNSSEKEKSDKEKPDKEKTSDKEVNLAGYSNDNIYKIAGLMVSEKLLDVGEVYNYLDPSDELLTSLSNHFYNILKTSPNKDTRDNSSVPVPLLKKIVSSHLNSNFLNSKTSRAHQVSSPRMKDKEQMSAKLDKENKLRKISHTMLETMVNKYECNDFSILLKFDNYHYLRDCIYSMESGKFLVLSTLLSQCSDFEGELWDVCYSYILHLYRLNFPIFLNTTVTQNLTHIMSKVLSKSELYQAAAEGNGSESDSVKLTLELLDKELVVVKKLEYYFKLVGFRSSENIILFNGILSYLHTLLSHLLRTQVGKDKNDKCVLGKKMIKKLIYRYILFSVMNCCEGNFQISDRIWSILNLFTTLERYQIYSKTLELLNGEEEMKQNSPKRSGKPTNWSQLENYYYKYQMCMIRKLYQTYNYKLRNIFKKITFELLKSVKSPTIRSIVSIITAISAINPFSVCTLIIRQSELFNNLLLPLCELTKYFLSYTIDIFVYQLTINLIHLTNNPTASSSRDTSPKSSDAKKEYSLSDNRLDHSYNLNEEESNKMYVNSVILCKIYKRHSECDIIPIVTILILILNYSMSNRLTLCPSGEGQLDVPDPKNLKSKLDNEDLVKLEITGICIGNYYNVIFVIYNVLDYLIRLIEIIGGMVDVDMNKMTQEQLLCQCGSYSLKNECLVSNVDDEVVSVNNKKSLVKVVCRPFFVNSLLLILGRLINELLYDSNFSNSKLLLAIVDKFNNLVMLLINFLEINEQTHLLPSKELLLKYYTENHLQFMNTVKAVKEPGELTTDSQSTSSLKRKRMEFTTDSVDTMLDDNFVGFINSLSIYDIYAPTEQYDTYISKLTSFVSTITTAGAGNTFRRAKRIKNRISTLETDKEEHINHSNVVLERLKEVFKSFVKNDAKVGPHITTRFISRIVFSRLLVSELNALFCCKIVDLIMENKMNYFNYFDFVNCYTKMLIPMISSLTEREVINLSIFFNHSFHLIKGWVNNREAFEKLVYDNPCFCTTFKFQPNREFKYQQLLQVIKKWEYFILLSIFSINKPTTSTNSANSATSANSTANSVSSVKDDKGRVSDLKNSAESEMASEPESVLPQKRSWIEIKNVVIFLNKVSSNFPITVNSSLKVLNFLKNVLKLAKQNNWQDVTVPSNTLIKLIQMYQNQNKYIVINIPATPSSNPASNPVTTPSTPVNVPSKNPTSKETSPRHPISKENSPKNQMSKETSPGSGPAKETSLKTSSSKETSPKTSSSKETSPKTSSSKETSPKTSSSKETSPKTGSKELSPKTGNSKETSPRSVPVKESVKSSSRTSITHGTDKR